MGWGITFFKPLLAPMEIFRALPPDELRAACWLASMLAVAKLTEPSRSLDRIFEAAPPLENWLGWWYR